MLLMVRNMPKYASFTASLLDYLLRLADSFAPADIETYRLRVAAGASVLLEKNIVSYVAITPNENTC